jgi:hypothetical protein
VIVITGIFGALRVFFPKVLQSIWQGVTTVGGFLLSPVSLPVWAVGVLVVLSVLAIVPFLNQYVISKKEPKLDEYTHDFFDGIIWRWKRIENDGMPDNSLWCFCPTCSNRLILRELGEDTAPFTDFHCVYCQKKIIRRIESIDSTLLKVKLEVERKIDTGEWKDVVRRSKAGNLVPRTEKPLME